MVVEEVPWSNGKHELINAYMLFWPVGRDGFRWKETTEAFRTSWDKVFDAVEATLRGKRECRAGLRAPEFYTLPVESSWSHIGVAMYSI